MRTSEIYEAQQAIALLEFPDIVVRAEISRLQSGETLKLRLFLSDDSFVEVHASATGRYSYHWERRLSGRSDIYRFDNAPHHCWQHVSTYPHHFHDGSEEMATESPLSTDPQEGLRVVCRFVREKLRSESLADHDD